MMENSTTGKRVSERNELEEPSAKKLKKEKGNRKDESNADNTENQQQRDMRTKMEEETHFLRLYTKVLNEIIKRENVDEDDIRKGISEIKFSFLPNQTFHETDFTKWENICGFLYRYASHGAGFARNRILNAIRNCNVVRNVFKKSDLRIICLGTGAGNDAVGLCSALSELKHPKNLNLTLVDKFKEWSSCIEAAKRFIREDNFGKVSELFKVTDVELLFIPVDLPGNLKSDKKYFKILGKADVILMSKFLTSLNRSNDGEHEKTIIKSLHQHTKEDVVILVNDKLVYFEERWQGFREIYRWGDKEEDEYRSTALAERRFRSNDDVTPSTLPVHVIVKNSGQI